MWNDFKKFALKGNVVDMAVGVIIGGAFGKIVTSLVNDLIMPLVGLLTGGINYSNLFLILGSVPEGAVITTLEDAMKPENAKENIRQTMNQVFRLL